MYQQFRNDLVVELSKLDELTVSSVLYALDVASSNYSIEKRHT